VLAAAIRGRADVIVTYNLKDFPEKVVSAHGVTAQHPDEFLTHLIDLAPGAVLSAIQRLRRSLTKPAVSVEEYLATLERQELSAFVSKLKEFKTLL